MIIKKRFKIFRNCFFIFLFQILPFTGYASGADSAKITTARLFLNKITAEDYTSAMLHVDWDLAGKINAAALQNIWQTIQNQSGKFKAVIDTYTEQKEEYTIVFQTCQFEKSVVDVKTSVNHANKIAGLFFVPPRSKEIYKLPSYANTQAIIETDLTIGSGQQKLPGVLTYPKQGSHFPAVVLVHGSGPSDRDESIGPNKMFKDLAYGLASRGVMVLRYDKRSFVYPEETRLKLAADSMTVYNETIDDAAEAVFALRKIVAVDTSRIFILGHSLGGMLAPLINEKSQVSGLILMAANARPLEDVILDQVKYIQSFSGSEQTNTEQLVRIKTQVMNVKILDASSDIDAWQLPLELPKNYWLSIAGYQPDVALKNSKTRALILQGGRDYQVTATDFNIWKKQLAGMPFVECKLYEKLNHLFMEGAAKSTPEEYNKAANVPPYVLDDLIRFITK